MSRFLGFQLKSSYGNKRVRDTIRFIESCRYLDLDVWNRAKGARVMNEALLGEMPQAIGKLGSTELQAIRNYLRYRGLPDWEMRIAVYQNVLYSHSGVFPDNPDTYARFCDFMLNDILPQLTVVGVWFNYREAAILKQYAPDAKRIPFTSFETYGFSGQRWTAHLAQKRVLVLHPFVNTIREQYAKRQEIWKDRGDILPDFELLQIAVPHYPALVPPRHPDWFAALEDMQQQMEAFEFDVALIGAGAYSLPLAVHARRLGKIGIHLGGATQLYFGITGGRWDDNSTIQSLKNEYWVRPLTEDTPENKELIEDGCYW